MSETEQKVPLPPMEPSSETSASVPPPIPPELRAPPETGASPTAQQAENGAENSESQSSSPFEAAFASAIPEIEAEIAAAVSSLPHDSLMPPPIPPDAPKADAGEAPSRTISASPELAELAIPPPVPVASEKVKVLLRRLSSLPASAPQDDDALQVTVRTPPPIPEDGRMQMTPHQKAACAVFRKDFESFFGISAATPLGTSDRLLKLRRRRNAATFRNFLEEANDVPDKPAAVDGVVAIGNLILATQLNPSRFFLRPNEQRLSAIVGGFGSLSKIKEVDAMLSGAVSFDALGEEVQARMSPIVDQFLDFLRFCIREALDPKDVTSAQKYADALGRRRFLTSQKGHLS